MSNNYIYKERNHIPLCMFFFSLIIPTIIILYLRWYLTPSIKDIQMEISGGVYSDFTSLSVLIQIAAKNGKVPIPIDVNMSNMIKWLKEFDVSFYMEILNYDYLTLDLKTYEVFDVWKNPVQLYITTNNKYTFISYGPNGLDEGGKVDDITYSFEPLKTNRKNSNLEKIEKLKSNSHK